MARVEVTKVLLAPSEGLRSVALDSPVAGSVAAGFRLRISGWALLTSPGPATLVLVPRHQWETEVPFGVARPDLGAAFPDVLDDALAGFDCELSTLELERDFRVGLAVVDHVGQRHHFAEIHGRRDPIPSYPARHSPLLLTTTGRSGSTWFASLLGQHPDISAYGPFAFEPKGFSYWFSLAQTLSRPVSQGELLVADVTGPNWWLGNPSSTISLSALEPRIGEWFGGEMIEDTIGMCAARAEAFNHRITEIDGKPDARYVLEKVGPNVTTLLVRESYPDSKEVVLVRDFRDVFCSILSYGSRRGRQRFGRETVISDDAFVDELSRRAKEMLAYSRRNPDAMLVRYEDLVRHPEAELTRVLETLDLSGACTAADLLSAAANSSQPDSARHRTTSSGDESIGRWKRELPPALKHRCDRMLSPLMREFGYE